MEVQILFLQGAGEGAHEWDLDFVNQLQDSLGENYLVHYPKLPTEESLSYLPWKRKIEEELRAIGKPLVVVGHSLGGSVFLKLLSEEMSDLSFMGVFLLACPFWGEPDWEVTEFMLAPDFASELHNAGDIFIYHSSDDEIVPFDHHKKYRQLLPEATVRTFENAGHEMLKAISMLSEDIQGLALK